MRHNYYHRTTRHHNTLQTIRSRRAEGWQLHSTHLLQAQHKNIPYAKFVTSVPDEHWTQGRTIRTMLRLVYSIMRVLPSAASVGLYFFKTILFGSIRKIYYICKIYDRRNNKISASPRLWHMGTTRSIIWYGRHIIRLHAKSCHSMAQRNEAIRHQHELRRGIYIWRHARCWNHQTHSKATAG